MAKGTKKKIVLASVLKPVGDPRMFEKIAQSLAENSHYSIFIVGYDGSYMNAVQNIRFKTLFNFTRLSPLRLLAPLRFFLYILKVYPDILVIHTHELIWAALLFKKLTKCSVIYDIQENYLYNHLYGHSYVWPLKYISGHYIRLKERLTWKSFDHLIFAEECYSKELAFITSNYTIIQNTFKKPSYTSQLAPESKQGAKRLVFTGTIATDTGVFHAIELARKLHHRNPLYYLVITGYCPDARVRRRIKYIAKRKKYIKLIWDDKPLNHIEIIREIEKSDFAIMAYEPLLNYRDRIPTKLFEYLSMQIPLISWTNPAWDAYIERYNAGICIDFNNYNADIILDALNGPFYTTSKPSSEVLWENEGILLRKLFEKL